MDRRLRDKVAVYTYVSILWGIALFGISYKFEGWGVDNIKSLFTDPIGVGSLLLVVVCVVLFVVNLVRKELSHDEFFKERDKRLLDLAQLRDEISGYLGRTYVLSKSSSLLDVRSYGLHDRPSITALYKISRNNGDYLRLKNDTDETRDLRDSIISLVERLSSDRLGRLVSGVFVEEQKVRSQEIAVRLYRKGYLHTKRNEDKLLKAESLVKFSKQRKKLYSYIGEMESGRDLE